MNSISKLRIQFGVWRAKNVSQNHFVLVLSLVIGIISGLAAVVLKNTIHLVRHWVVSQASHGEFNFLLLFLPMIGILITVLLVRYVIRDNLSHGISKILHAISQTGGMLKLHHTFSSVLTSTFTIALGGSVGAEAPIVLTGSAIGSNLGRFFRMNHKTIMLLIGCGAAGAVGGIFQAPIAGVIFTIEVLMLDLTTLSIAPLLIASVSGTTISYFFLGKDAEFNFLLVHPFDLHNIPYYILLGVVGGFVALYFNHSVMALEVWYGKIKRRYTKWLVGGSILSLLIFLFPPFYGEGYPTISALLNNNISELFSNSPFYNLQNAWWAVPLFLLLLIGLKVVATASTNGAGGVGGVFAPSLFMGGVTGFLVARLLNLTGWVDLPEGYFALAGMSALMSGIMHAPLMAIFLIAEITNGYGLFVPLMISSALAFVTVKSFDRHNLYTKQLAMKGELITRHKDQAVLTLMKLNKVIETDFVTVRPRMTLGELVNVVSQSRRNIFPVLNSQEQLVGVVSLDDIRHIMFNQEMYNTTTVDKLMIIPPAMLDIDANMDKVMEIFEKTGAWNLPVIEKGQYMGFVSKSKIFSVYRRVLINYSDE